MILQVAIVFGLQGRSYALMNSGALLDANTDPSKLEGNAVAVVPVSGGNPQTPSINGSACR